MAMVMDTMAILMATTMVTGIVIIVVQGVALAISDEIKEHGDSLQKKELPHLGCIFLPARFTRRRSLVQIQ